MFNEQVLAKIGISKEDIHFVNDLAYTAGQTAKKRYEDGLTDIETKSEPDDFVTEVDKELSYFLTGKLKERFPDFNIISEEETPDSNINNDITTWVIDPIDGTSNYINNDGKYSVMIGLLRNCIPLIGWVYIPSEDRLIVGIPDDGLYEKKSQNEIYKKEINTENTLPEKKIKLMMGIRDRKKKPQIKYKIYQFDLLESVSICIKFIEII
ncbi:MAG: inositol monophosphatase, partial [Vampirovibrionia bacterium]